MISANKTKVCSQKLMIEAKQIKKVFQFHMEPMQGSMILF